MILFERGCAKVSSLFNDGQAMIDVAADNGWLSATLHVMTLMQMIMQVQLAMVFFLLQLQLQRALYLSVREYMLHPAYLFFVGSLEQRFYTFHAPSHDRGDGARVRIEGTTFTRS